MSVPVELSWCQVRPMECDRCGATWPNWQEKHLSVSLPERHERSDDPPWREFLHEALCDACALDLLGYMRWRVGPNVDLSEFFDVIEARASRV